MNRAIYHIKAVALNIETITNQVLIVIAIVDLDIIIVMIKEIIIQLVNIMIKNIKKIIIITIMSLTINLISNQIIKLANNSRLIINQLIKKKILLIIPKISIMKALLQLSLNNCKIRI